MHVGTPPTGELGAVSHLDSFVSSVPHSSFKTFVMIFGQNSQTSSIATRNQPFIVVGDFNVQLLDELSSAPGAVGPHFHWEKTIEEEMAMQEKGQGESNHVRFFELIFQ